MIQDNHYNSLKSHISSFIFGLSNHGDELPGDLNEKISEDFYLQALHKLEKRKKKLEKRQTEYLREVEKFNEDYELIRKVWKRDIIRIKRQVRKSETLQALGIPKIK